jgi:hypothetical protein
MSVKMRIEVEKKIVRAFLKSAYAKGFKVSMDLDDEDAFLKKYPTVAKAMADIFDLDDARVYVWKEGESKPEGWIYFVFGNDGWDAISDYTVNLEEELGLLVEANKISDKYAG